MELMANPMLDSPANVDAAIMICLDMAAFKEKWRKMVVASMM